MTFIELRDEYMRILRNFFGREPVMEPFITRWRPSVGEIQFTEDQRSSMQWGERLGQWIVKAIEVDHEFKELPLTKAFFQRSFVHQYPLGALPYVLEAIDFFSVEAH
jgi:hypothetical protein